MQNLSLLHLLVLGRAAFAVLLVPFLSLLATALPAQSPAKEKATDEKALAAKVDALCKPLLDGDAAVGFVVGIVDGDRTWVRGYGGIVRGQDSAPDGDTLYEIGSISKVFTSVLLADAVTRGLCSLDDPVQKHLPDGVVLRPWQEQHPVLLWHLATHTSGLPRMPDIADGDEKNPYAHFDEPRLRTAIGAARARREPGSVYEYSNLGAGILGYVVTRANGCASYDEALRKRITGPLGMNDTAVVLADALRARLAPPYDAELAPSHVWDLAWLAGAGGIRSSMHDMLKFVRSQLTSGDGTNAHANGPNANDAEPPLAKAAVLAQTKRHDGTRGIAMGLGWHFARDGSTRWHNGQTGGYHGWVGIRPDERRGVCVLTNTSAGDVDALGERIVQHLCGVAVEPQKVDKPVAVDRALLQRLVGKYRMSPAMEFAITLGEDGLSAQLTDQPALRVFPRSPTEFFYRAVPASLVFEVDGDKVTGLVLHQDGRELRCRRVDEAAAK